MKNTLKQAVIEQLGYENESDIELIGVCEDITNHGISGGFGLFTYYADTIKFYDDNKSDIIDLCREYANEFGTTVSSMVAGFGCVNCSELEVEAFFMGSDENDAELKNALAWFAAEEVAREISEAN